MSGIRRKARADANMPAGSTPISSKTFGRVRHLLEPNEMLLKKCNGDSTLLRGAHGTGQVAGTLMVTNFRLFFVAETSLREMVRQKSALSERTKVAADSIPVMSINGVQWHATKGTVRKQMGMGDVEQRVVDITTKIGRATCFALHKHEFASWLEDHLRAMFRSPKDHLFALTSPPSNFGGSRSFDQWRHYSPHREYERMGFIAPATGTAGSGGGTDGLEGGSKWRLTTRNRNFGFSPTYPAAFVVPSTIDDDTLVRAARFRTKGRIPAVVWRDQKTGATISRSSQPGSGLKFGRSREDERLVQHIWASSSQPYGNYSHVIVDCRPFKNAQANAMKGGGFENVSFYGMPDSSLPEEPLGDSEDAFRRALRTASTDKTRTASMEQREASSADLSYSARECELNFANIENIHVVRDSFSRIADICNNDEDDSDFDAQLAGSGWLKHVTSVLAAASAVAGFVREDGRSVLVHCSDGWDRTTQVSGCTGHLEQACPSSGLTTHVRHPGVVPGVAYPRPLLSHDRRLRSPGGEGLVQLRPHVRLALLPWGSQAKEDDAAVPGFHSVGRRGVAVKNAVSYPI